jgi:hypothetical protein
VEDLLALALTGGFFALAYLYLRSCERIVGKEVGKE